MDLLMSLYFVIEQREKKSNQKLFPKKETCIFAQDSKLQ